MKLAESLSPITNKLDEVNETSQNLGEINKKSKPETLQPAIENTQQQLRRKNDQDDTQPGILYDVSLKNTLTNRKDKQKGFFKIKKDQNAQRFCNGIPVEISSDSRIATKGKDFIITPNLQNDFTDTSGKSLKKLDKTETLTNKQLLKTLNYKKYKHKSEEMNSGRYKNSKDILILINLQGRGIGKKCHSIEHN